MMNRIQHHCRIHRLIAEACHRQPRRARDGRLFHRAIWRTRRRGAEDHRRHPDHQDRHQPVLRRHGRRAPRRPAKARASTLTTAAGKEDGDEDSQIQAIENAIAQGDEGILITPSGPGVNPRDREGPRRRACSSSPSTPRPTRRTRSTSRSPPTTSRPAS